MNGLQVFNSPEFGDIRAVEVDGEPWFVGKDMAEALGYSNPRDALATHVDDEDKNTVAIHDGIRGNPNLTIINESGLYSLIFSSKLPKAKEFKRWVTSVVLPSIRRRGAYIAPQAQPEGVEAAALQAVVQPITAALEALTGVVQAMSRRLDGLEQRPRQQALPPDGGDPFADRPVSVKPPSNKMRRQWMRTASEKLDALGERCGLPSSSVLHALYQELEEDQCVILSEVRLKALEEHQLADCSVLLAIFYDTALRRWFEKRVDHYLSEGPPAW